MKTQRYIIVEKLIKHGSCRTKRLAELMHTTRNNIGPALRALREGGYVTSKEDVSDRRVSSNQPHIWTATGKIPPDGPKKRVRVMKITYYGQGNQLMNAVATMPLVRLA